MKSNFKDVEIRYVFTQEERNALGPLIARLSQDKQEKEDEKKEAVQEFNAEIKSIEKKFNENVNRMNNGWETRTIPARSYKNYATSEWEYYSVDNFDLIKTVPFGPYDYQMDVDDNDKSEPQPFSRLDDEIPAAEGTEETNPTLFTILLRELTYWREQLIEVEKLDDQDAQIDAGAKIQEKINRIETALHTMEVKSETAEKSENDRDDDELNNPLTDDEPTSPDPVPPGTDGGGMAPDSPEEFENDLKQDDGIYSADQPADTEPTDEDKNAVGYGKSVTRVRTPGGRFGSKKDTGEV